MEHRMKFCVIQAINLILYFLSPSPQLPDELEYTFKGITISLIMEIRSK